MLCKCNKIFKALKFKGQLKCLNFVCGARQLMTGIWIDEKIYSFWNFLTIAQVGKKKYLAGDSINEQL